jgi:hypothetical protein
MRGWNSCVIKKKDCPKRWRALKAKSICLKTMHSCADCELVAPRSQFVEVVSANGLSFGLTFSYYAVEKSVRDIKNVLNKGAITAEEALQFRSPDVSCDTTDCSQ